MSAIVETNTVEAAPDLLPPQCVVPRARVIRRVGARLVWLARGTASAAEWLFGALTLVVGLSFLAAAPVLQFLSLGYLLEASGRVARSGRLREGFVGVRRAARVGGMFLGAWLWLLPLRYVSDLRTSARLIDPAGPSVRFWHRVLVVLTAVVVLHVLGAVGRGGRLRHFLWPWVNPLRGWRLVHGGQAYSHARDAVWTFVTSLHLPHYFRLGLWGFLGGLAWLAPPVTLIALGRHLAPLGFLGALWLFWVLAYIPLLQAHLAVTGRWQSMFERRAMRDALRRAPLACAAALVATLLMAVPLYLLKIEMVPREAAWLPSLVFVIFIFPARLLVGWAYARAARRATPRWWPARLVGRLALAAAAIVYVAIVFFSQYTAWHGIWSLYEQHAFLVPAPFLGL